MSWHRSHPALLVVAKRSCAKEGKRRGTRDTDKQPREQREKGNRRSSKEMSGKER
jgi:hypothetical protein